MRAAAVVIGLLAAGCGIGPGRAYRVPEMSSDYPAPRNVSAPRGGKAAADFLPLAPPELVRWNAVAKPEPVERRLSNGVRVLVLPRHGFPVARITLVIHGTTDAPPPVMVVFGRALGDIGDPRDSVAYRELGFDGGTISSTTFADGIAVGITALSPAIVSASSRYWDLLVTPKFTGAGVRFAKASVRHVVTPSSPGRTANRALRGSLFPTGHPYHALVESFTAEDIEAVDAEALSAFRDRYLSAENVSIVAVGDVDGDALIPALERGLANLPRHPNLPGPPLPPSTSMPASTCSDRVERVRYPGATQATFAIGYATVPGANADTSGLEVAAAVLSRRLDAQLRQLLGSTWHVKSTPVSMARGGFFEITGAADPTRTAEVLATISSQVDSLREQLVSDEELQAAKKEVSDRALDVFFVAALDLPLAAIASRSEKIRSITAEDVRATAARYLGSERRCTVVVADGAQ